jgi:hypothetical protein
MEQELTRKEKTRALDMQAFQEAERQKKREAEEAKKKVRG